MAETPSKRQRSETHVEDVEEIKRHKSYNDILSLLDEEEEVPGQDVSSLVTTLQQELDPLSSATTETDQENSCLTVTPAIQDCPSSSSSSSSSSSTLLKEDEEDDKDRVIRHLLEASDDELGIPNRETGSDSVDDGYEGFVNWGNEFNGADEYSLCDGLWEIEDANANYYALLQSELFM